MNSNVKIVLSDGNVQDVEALAYINLQGSDKNFLLYTLNEVANGELVKIYIVGASEEHLVPPPLTDEEWAKLKEIMMNISHKEAVPEVTYKPFSEEPFTVGPAKKLAVKADVKQSFADAQNTAIAPKAAGDEAAFVSTDPAIKAPFFDPTLNPEGKQETVRPETDMGPSAFGMEAPSDAPQAGEHTAEVLQLDPLANAAQPIPQPVETVVATPVAPEAVVPAPEAVTPVVPESTVVETPVVEPVAVVEQPNVEPIAVVEQPNVEPVATETIEPIVVQDQTPQISEPIDMSNQTGMVIPEGEEPAIPLTDTSNIPAEPITTVELTPVENTVVTTIDQNVVVEPIGNEITLDDVRKAMEDAKKAVEIMNAYLEANDPGDAKVIEPVTAVETVTEEFVEPTEIAEAPVETISTPVVETVVTPVAEPVTEVAPEVAPEPVVETPAEPVAEPIATPTVDPTLEVNTAVPAAQIIDSTQVVETVETPAEVITTPVETVATPVETVAAPAVAEPVETVAAPVTEMPTAPTTELPQTIETISTPVETTLIDTSADTANVINTGVATASSDEIVPEPLQPIKPGSEAAEEPAYNIEGATPQTILLDPQPVTPAPMPNSANSINNTEVSVSIPEAPVAPANPLPLTPQQVQAQVGIPDATPEAPAAPVAPAPVPAAPAVPEVPIQSTAPQAVQEISNVNTVPVIPQGMDVSAINTDITLPPEMSNNPNAGTISEGVFSPATLDANQQTQQ